MKFGVKKEKVIWMCSVWMANISDQNDIAVLDDY